MLGLLSSFSQGLVSAWMLFQPFTTFVFLKPQLCQHHDELLADLYSGLFNLVHQQTSRILLVALGI